MNSNTPDTRTPDRDFGRRGSPGKVTVSLPRVYCRRTFGRAVAYLGFFAWRSWTMKLVPLSARNAT